MNTDKAMAFFILGVLVTCGAIGTWKEIDRRFSGIERRVNAPVGIGVPPDQPSDMEERMRQIRREGVRELAEWLREEGLVIAEASQ